MYRDIEPGFQQFFGFDMRWCVPLLFAALVIGLYTAVGVYDIIRWHGLVREVDTSARLSPEDLTELIIMMAAEMHCAGAFATVTTAWMTARSTATKGFQDKYCNAAEDMGGGTFSDDASNVLLGNTGPMHYIRRAFQFVFRLTPLAVLWPISEILTQKVFSTKNVWTASVWLVGYIGFVAPCLVLLSLSMHRAYNLSNYAIECLVHRIKEGESAGWGNLTAEIYEFGRDVDKMWHPREAGGPWWVCLAFSFMLTCAGAVIVITNGKCVEHLHFVNGLGVALFFVAATFCTGCLYQLARLTSMMSSTRPSSTSIITVATRFPYYRDEQTGERPIDAMTFESRQNFQTFVWHVTEFARTAPLGIKIGICITKKFVVENSIKVVFVLPSVYALYMKTLNEYGVSPSTTTTTTTVTSQFIP